MVSTYQILQKVRLSDIGGELYLRSHIAQTEFNALDALRIRTDWYEYVDKLQKLGFILKADDTQSMVKEAWIEVRAKNRPLDLPTDVTVRNYSYAISLHKALARLEAHGLISYDEINRINDLRQRGKWSEYVMSLNAIPGVTISNNGDTLFYYKNTAITLNIAISDTGVQSPTIKSGIGCNSIW
jgi:hypothetical protein